MRHDPAGTGRGPGGRCPCRPSWRRPESGPVTGQRAGVGVPHAVQWSGSFVTHGVQHVSSGGRIRRPTDRPLTVADGTRSSAEPTIAVASNLNGAWAAHRGSGSPDKQQNRARLNCISVRSSQLRFPLMGDHSTSQGQNLDQVQVLDGPADSGTGHPRTNPRWSSSRIDHRRSERDERRRIPARNRPAGTESVAGAFRRGNLSVTEKPTPTFWTGSAGSQIRPPRIIIGSERSGSIKINRYRISSFSGYRSEVNHPQVLKQINQPAGGERQPAGYRVVSASPWNRMSRDHPIAASICPRHTADRCQCFREVPNYRHCCSRRIARSG